MAVSQIHVRSISLPSRLHPINSTGFEAELQKLKSATTCVTSDTIQSGLVGLAELYNSIDELTQSPSTQQSIKDSRSIEEALEGSVVLLDSCSTIRELVQIMRENVRALQSALRRKGLDSGIQNDVASYICSRKRMNKCIKKGLKTLKNSENKINASSVDEESLMRALREVHGLTIAIFKSALLFFSSSAIKSGGWNLVSRLMINKSADHSVVTEVGCVDFAVNDLLRNGDKQMVQKSLQNLDSCVEGIEAGFERMFRQLLQSRVNLLNIVTNH